MVIMQRGIGYFTAIWSTYKPNFVHSLLSICLAFKYYETDYSYLHEVFLPFAGLVTLPGKPGKHLEFGLENLENQETATV